MVECRSSLVKGGGRLNQPRLTTYIQKFLFSLDFPFRRRMTDCISLGALKVPAVDESDE